MTKTDIINSMHWSLQDGELLAEFERTPHILLKRDSQNIYLTTPNSLPPEGLQFDDFVFH